MSYGRSDRPLLRLPFLLFSPPRIRIETYVVASTMSGMLLASPGLLSPSPVSPPLGGAPGARKRAVLVGVSYLQRRGGLEPLMHAHQDIRALKRMLEEQGFECVVMLDKPGQQEHLMPRRPNILRELAKLVRQSRAGDRLVFAFSGHGKQLPTQDRDEEDFFDEHILPHDWEQWGIISDNDLRKILVDRLPSGVKLLTIVDACHSGTILDLRYNWYRRQGFFSPWHFPPLSPSEVLMGRLFGGRLPSQVLCLSASRDALPAYELGRCSYIRLLLTAYANNPDITIRAAYNQVTEALNARLHGHVHPTKMQRPQISSNDPFINLEVTRLADFL